MIFKVKIKPQVYKAKTKHQVMMQLSNSFFGYTLTNDSTYGTYIELPHLKDFVRVYNLEKHKPKHKQIRSKTTGQYIKSKLVKTRYWQAFVYDIPKALLKMEGLKVEQKLRNFKLIKK